MPKHRRRRNTADDEVEESSSDDDDDLSREDRRKHKKTKKSKQKDKKRKKRKHRHDRREEDSEDSSDEDSREKERRRRKKEKKRRKRQRRTDSEEEKTVDKSASQKQNHVLAQALCRLFSERPVFAQELPILLIRLAGGSSFDLRQMNDYVAATALEGVLECLKEYGVEQNNGEWVFQALPGVRSDERILLRVIRSLLDDVGVSMKAVHDHEEKAKEEALLPRKTRDPEAEAAKDENTNEVVDKIKRLTSDVVLKYQSKDAELGSQLASLCQIIAQGESISIDGLPDEELRTALEQIFMACGLEKSEMADEGDDSSGDDNDNKKQEGRTFGYGLPEDASDAVQLGLAAIMEACRNPQRRVLGPMRPTQAEAAMKDESEEEDEGPFLPGESRRPRGPVIPDHLLKAQADYRQLELKATAAGVEMPAASGQREEWMLVPGKHDFLSNIKAGQSMKSRGFQNKKTRGEDTTPAPVHPAIQAEMDSIMQAHQDARGPSLIDQHRAMKREAKKAEDGKKKQWDWNREKDLDEGRRVDKDALHMVLGGASDNLKTKFQGGFN